MYKATVVLMVLVLAVAAGTVYGQGYGADEEAYEGFRARVGWVDAGDADDALGFGVDYIWEDIMASVDYTSPSVDSTDIDIWGVAGSYLWRTPERPGTYYGAGAGWYRVSAGGEHDSSIGYHVLAGTEFGADASEGPSWLAELRYVFGTDFDGDDIDGIRVMLGRRF